MKITNDMVCYYCGKKAVSSEHVPPKCFFPENRRNNLIQVPGCSQHNEQTSKDDNYVLLVISAFIGNNLRGVNHSVVKVRDTLKRSKALFSIIKANSVPVLAVEGNDVHKTTMFEFDRSRFDGEIIKMAKALFYHTYNKQWDKPLFVGTPSVLSNGEGALIMILKDIFKQNGFDRDISFIGSNPDIFKYRFIVIDDPDTPILQMVFYEGFEVWVFVNKDS